MKKKITLLLFVLYTVVVQADNFVNKVIILNEGHYDYVNQVQTVPVTVGSYDPVTRLYTSFDTIYNARFGSHVIVDGSNIFVAADNQLVRYDADSHQRLATATLAGVRKIAVWNNQLLISRGEYGIDYASYFVVYDKNNLSFLYDLPVASGGPQYASEGIVINNDTAYLAINNGFNWGNEVGIVGRIDLANQSYINEIDLGAGATNPENLILDGGSVYTFNNTNYSTSSITKIDIGSQTTTTNNLNTTSGCGATGFASGNILFEVSGDTRIRRFNTSSFIVLDTLQMNRSIYGMATDEINNLIYVGETDYTTNGRIFILDFTGATVDSFDVSVSPGNIALDIRSATGINEPSVSGKIFCYPNPAADHLNVFISGKNNSTKETFVLTDITGREAQRITSDQQSFLIDIQSLDAGIYTLRSLTNANMKTKIVKQ